MHAVPISNIERKRAQGRRRGRRFFRSLPFVSICPLFCPGCLPTPQPIASADASIGKSSEAARTPCLVGGSFPPNGEESKNGKPAKRVDNKKHCEIMTQFLLRPARCASPKKSNLDLQWSLGSFPFDFSASAQKIRQETASTLLANFPSKNSKPPLRRRDGVSDINALGVLSRPVRFFPLLSLPLLSLFFPPPLFFLFTPLSLFSPAPCEPGAGRGP